MNSPSGEGWHWARWQRFGHRVGLALPLLCTTLLQAHQAQAIRAAATAHFVPASCPFKPGAGLSEGSTIRCGYLVVPEDRSVLGGRTIRLAVAIYKSQSPTPAPDPVVWLQGGPGGDIIAPLASQLTAQTMPLLAGPRDLILLDQRGTGFSRPSLRCPEYDAIQYGTLDQNLSTAAQLTLAVAATHRCHDRLVGQGVSLQAYTTSENATDVGALGAALGYQQLNLMGFSYGTRLVMAVMRDHPTGIRSVVLDSVFPVQENFFRDQVTNPIQPVRLLFKRCTVNPACAQAFPQLEHVYYGLIRALNAKPVEISATDANSGKRYHVLITGRVLADLMSQAFYFSPSIVGLPSMIFKAKHGDFSEVARLYGVVGFSPSISWGMFLSVACADDAANTSAGDIAKAARGLPPEIRQDSIAGDVGLLRICSFWTKTREPARTRAPISSSIPTLLLEGEFDPITPPSNARLAAHTLSKSRVVVFPGLGHGVFFQDQCPIGVVLSFLDHPMSAPDTACVAPMRDKLFP